MKTIPYWGYLENFGFKVVTLKIAKLVQDAAQTAEGELNDYCDANVRLVNNVQIVK